MAKKTKPGGRRVETLQHAEAKRRNIPTAEYHRDVARLGRKTRLPESRRRALWAVFEQVRASLRERKR